jgi:serine/threonine-protein kinase
MANPHLNPSLFAGAPPAAKFPTPGTVITTLAGAQYRVVKVINAGGYAVVYEGINKFGNVIALKVYKPSPDPAKSLNQWLQEIALFQKLKHPNVVSIHDAFQCEGLLYIVLERAWGNLSDYMKVASPINNALVRELATQLLAGISHMHAHGVIHRDLSITNVLVFHGPPNGWPIFKISDFGISKAFLIPWQPKVCTTGTGHPWFVPPELIQYGYTNELSDLYHLGLILLFVLTGHLPFSQGMTRQQIHATITSGVPRRLAEAVGTPLGGYISVLLRRTQQYRFQSAQAALNYLLKMP